MDAPGLLLESCGLSNYFVSRKLARFCAIDPKAALSWLASWTL